MFSAVLTRLISPLRCKTITHKTGLSIAALDISPQRTHVVLAGREILKTVRVSEYKCAEEFNLRSTIIAYGSTHTPVSGVVSAKHKDQLAASDVKWSHGRWDSSIATAAVNGRIVIYDVNRPGVELARLHEHNRQVHKVAFNPHEGALLLSGSQDASVKLWDLRALSGDRSVMTCRSIHRYTGNNNGVRDVKWSPTDGVEFATGTDDGVVQRWDLRKDNAPLLKINAHENTCHSIDWHPDGIHLASASADKNVKVWDFKSVDRRQKPHWEFRAPQAVLNVRWRPPCLITEGNSQATRQCTHLATSYDHRDPRIHLWDFRRPHIPFRELDHYNNAPTDLLWHSEDLLWTVGNDGVFTQTDIHFAPRVLERHSLQAYDWSPDGTMISFSQKRPPRRASGIEDGSTGFLGNASKSKGDSGERISGSQSVTDGSLEDGFLGSSVKKRHSKSSSTRSSKSLASTPPSGGNNGLVANLGKALEHRAVYAPSPLSIARYHVAGTFDPHVFRHLAQNYVTLPEKMYGAPIPYRLDQLLHRICGENATQARYAGQFRLAQSWRMIGLAIAEDLEARATNNRYLRIAENQATSKLHRLAFARGADQISSHAAKAGRKEEHSLKSFVEHTGNCSIAAAGVESSSNMTTPLARPVGGSSVPKDLPMDLCELNEEDLLETHSGGYWSRSGIGSSEKENSAVSTVIVHGSSPDADDTAPKGKLCPEGYEPSEWRELYNEERRAALVNYKPSPRPILTLDHPLRLGIEVPKRTLNRHDSNESFPMFSASTDSSLRGRSAVGSLRENESFGSLGPLAENWTMQHENQETIELEKISVSSGINLTSGSHVAIMSGNEGNEKIPPLIVRDDSNHYGTIASARPAQLTRGGQQTSPHPRVRQSNSDHSQKLIVNALPTHVRTIISEGVLAPDPNLVNSSFMPSDFALSSDSTPTTALLVSQLTATAFVSKLMEHYTQNLSDAQLPVYLLHLLWGDQEPAFLIPDLTNTKAEALLTSYHTQLCSLGLYEPAAKVRKFCVRISPDLAEQGMTEVHVRLWCVQCEKPLENKGRNQAGGLSQWVCERCETTQAACPVCWRRKLRPIPLDYSSSLDMTIGEDQWKNVAYAGQALWSSCLTCGHGGHDDCLKTWFMDADASEGGCPVQGCLHDCVAGVRRDQRIRSIAEEKVRQKRGLAKRDAWVVGESRAVEKVRSTLQAGNAGDHGGATAAEGDGALHSGWKKVRPVPPDKDQQDQIEERRPSEARPIPPRSSFSGIGGSRNVTE